jgi:hypothetical protein
VNSIVTTVSTPHGACCSGDPGHLDKAVALEPQKTAVVGMALPFIMSLEKENGVHLGFHQNQSGSGEPAVESFRPSAK